MIGYGTYKADHTEKDVRLAIEAGYRLIDTASIYGNEKEVGAGIRDSGISRSDISLTTKCWLDETGYEGAKAALGRSLKRLGTDYADTYLVHWPRRNGDENWQDTLRGTWKAFIELRRDGYIKEIGVSNFLPHHLKVIEDMELPAVNQLELHPGYIQEAALEYSKSIGITVQAWSPLGRGDALKAPYIQELASKYGKHPAQVCLRYLMQRDIVPICKSSSEKNLKSNLDLYDFLLTEEEMSLITCSPQSNWRGEHPDLGIPTAVSSFSI